MAEKEQALTPANANPWYVLMTLYGEQAGEVVDDELHEKNRAAWNAWAVHSKPSKRDEAVHFIPDLPSPDAWHNIGAEVRTMFEREFARRNPDVAVLTCPEPWGNDSIDMKKLYFTNQLSISQFLIPKIVRLSESKFERQLVAQTAVFLGLASFARSYFGGITTFQNSKFCQVLDLRNSEFEEGLNLQSIKCVDLDLMDSRFSRDLTIADAACSGLANMSQMMPLRDAKWNLSGFQFSVLGATYLNGTFVKGAVDFRHADFRWEFSAASLIAAGDVDFSKGRFAKDAHFTQAKFAQSVSFFQTIFAGRAYFDGVVFAGSLSGTVNFQDCTFKEPTTFYGTKFVKLYPSFAGSILHDKTTFTDLSGNWPRDNPADSTQAKACCATIRHNLGKQGLPEAEHFFFRREMEFAGQIGGWWSRLPYRLFGWVSDYGYSILLPFLWLCLLIVGGGYALAYGVAGSAAAVTFEQGLGLSFANVFNFLAFHKTFATEDFMAELPTWLKAFSGFQSIAGVVLLFFLGLGLRTRFRMR